jgi:hypothetical protein
MYNNTHNRNNRNLIIQTITQKIIYNPNPNSSNSKPKTFIVTKLQSKIKYIPFTQPIEEVSIKDITQLPYSTLTYDGTLLKMKNKKYLAFEHSDHILGTIKIFEHQFIEFIETVENNIVSLTDVTTKELFETLSFNDFILFLMDKNFIDATIK